MCVYQPPQTSHELWTQIFMTDYLLLKDTVFKTRPSRNKCQDPNSSPLLTRILHGDVLFPSCVPFTGCLEEEAPLSSMPISHKPTAPPASTENRKWAVNASSCHGSHSAVMQRDQPSRATLCVLQARVHTETVVKIGSLRNFLMVKRKVGG